LLDNVIKGKEKYIELNLIIRDVFKLGKAKHLKYSKLKARNAMLFIAYILDPCYKALIITIIMPNQRNKLLIIAKKYIITE
jgi:hypothetical protein